MRSSGRQAERDVYLILDQAEEYFVYHGEDTAFEEALAELVTRSLRVNVLLSLREDTLARLDRLKALIPNLFGNVLRLDRLDRASGRAAIVGPLERWGELHSEEVTAEEPLVDDVLDGVGAGRIELGPPGGQGAVAQNGDSRIEAPYLQLVMQRLWEVERAAGSTTLRAATLAGLGGAGRSSPTTSSARSTRSARSSRRSPPSCSTTSLRPRGRRSRTRRPTGAVHRRGRSRR